MVPRKLVEIAFRRIWLLVIPILAIPVAIVALDDAPAEYRASAVVWISAPPGGTPALGHENPYLSPSANQANALNDLLTTATFRDAVATKANLPGAAEGGVLLPGVVTSYASGVNLLVIAAVTQSPAASKAIVTATIDQYNQRAAEQARTNAEISDQSLRQQLTVAEAELESRKKALEEYVRANPDAVTPGSAASLDFEYQTLLKRVEDQARVLAELQGQLQDVQLTLVSAPQDQQAAFAVQDEPEAPTVPMPVSSTRRFGFPLAGLLLGALLSASYLYILYRTDHSVLSSEDLVGLEMPLLGQVPELQQSSWLSRVPVVSRIAAHRQRDFARHTASTISSDAGQRV